MKNEVSLLTEGKEAAVPCSSWKGLLGNWVGLSPHCSPVVCKSAQQGLST